MFCCWEDYGLVSRSQVIDFLNSRLTLNEKNLATKVLEDIAQRAAAAFCKYNTETALKLLEALGGSKAYASIRTSHLKIIK